MKRKPFKHVLCLLCVLCVCFLTFCGCSSSGKTSVGAKAQDAAEQTTATEPESTEETPDEPETDEQEAVVPEFKDEQEKKEALEALLGIGQQMVRHVEGIEVVSGRVERVGSGRAYAPNPGEGFFTVNGTVAENSEIMFTIGQATLLRYALVLNSTTNKTAKAEIRVYKKGKLLLSCTQEKLQLQEGANDVDVCLDTGEDGPCNGSYNLLFYLDGVLINKYLYEA